MKDSCEFVVCTLPLPLRVPLPAVSRANSWNAFNNVSRLIPCYRYDVEADNLYGVTWYKDNEQFYKYEDKGNPKKHRTFDVAGVKVNVSTKRANPRTTIVSPFIVNRRHLFFCCYIFQRFDRRTLRRFDFCFVFYFGFFHEKARCFCKNRKPSWRARRRGKGLFLSRVRKRIRQTGKWQLRMGSKRVRQEMKNVCNPGNAKYFNSDGLV